MTESTALSLSGTLGPWSLVFLGVASLLLLLWTHHTLDPALPRRYRFSVIGLRLGALILGGFIVLQPTLVSIKRRPLPKRVAVLLDLSESIFFAPDIGLAQKMEKLASNLEVQLEKSGVAVTWFGFSDQLIPLPGHGPAQLSCRPGGTDIFGAINELTQKAPGLAGVVVISDGVTTTGRSTIDQVKRHLPVNTILLDRPQIRVDAKIKKVFADSFGFVRKRLPIEVDLQTTGLDNINVEVNLTEDNSLISIKKTHITAHKSHVVFHAQPKTEGRHIYTVSLVPVAGDENPDNDEATVEVNVVRDRIRVLHLAGTPSWDVRFLRHLFRSWPIIDLVSFYVLRTPQQSKTNQSGLSLIPFPTKELFERNLEDFDVIVFQDFDPADVNMDVYLDDILKYIERGGGLVVLGGPRGLTAPALSRSALGAALPLPLLPGNTPLRRLVDETPFLARPVKGAATHPLLQLGSGAVSVDQLFKSLPRLNTFVRSAGIRKGTGVLLVRPETGGDRNQGEPLLAVRTVGRGHIVQFCSNDSWRWHFEGAITGGAADLYADFWKQMIRFAANDQQLGQVRVILPREPIVAQNEVEMTIALQRPDLMPLGGAPVSITLHLAQKGQNTAPGPPVSAQGVTDVNGRFRFSFQFDNPGTVSYLIESAPNQLSAEGRFLVSPKTTELTNIGTDQSLMKTLARATGGVFTNSAVPPRLVTVEGSDARVLKRSDQPIWSHPALLLLLFGLLFGEWGLRRRFSLG